MEAFTVVLGIDQRTIRQLNLVWPTWVKHKPSLMKNPFVVFYDREEMVLPYVKSAIPRHNGIDIKFVPWPPEGAVYPEGRDKWTNPQRHKMLAGFVHVPAKVVETKYWLKLDTDVVATGMNDWIDSEWFGEEPVIVAPAWGYTKPPDQMMKLDDWVDRNYPKSVYAKNPPLNLVPEEGARKVVHKRIASWCGFFSTWFTEDMAEISEESCPLGHIPVPSQDGFMWYIAERTNFGVHRVKMKTRGWAVRNGERGIKKMLEEIK